MTRYERRKKMFLSSSYLRPSSVTCHVKASPLTFSASNSLLDRGNVFFHKRSSLGRCGLTTGLPNVIRAPNRSQPD